MLADKAFDKDTSDDEDSTDDELGKSSTEIYLEAGLKIDEKDISAPEISDTEKPILVDILTALNAAKDGYNFLAMSARLLEKAVLKAPNLTSLSKILSSATSFDPLALAAAKAQSKHPKQSVNIAVPKEFKPQKNSNGKFSCRLCTVEKGSWGGMDSHIRSKHSKIFYGPCGEGCTFSTPNLDSYRRHKLNCSCNSNVR